MTVITRFAPSPTGYLHIGGARTALFNWLYARKNHGKFLLRIEDTDRERSTDDAIRAIIEGMNWLGLEHDGEVIYQFARAERHREVAHKLLEAGHAYRCYTTAEELASLREKATQEGKVFRFESPWRDSSERLPDAPFVIRIKAPKEGVTIVHDAVQGNVEFANSTLDDMVLLRSDGNPTYMLSVVVDDFDMNISHIIRGDDHLNNAARQSLIYAAMGWKIPVFAHIPLIHGADGAKMSKRHGAVGLENYRDMGYLPEAMRNYLLRLGWSHGDEEIIPTEKAIEWFNLEAIGKAPARFDLAKLNSINAHYLREMKDEDLADIIISSTSGSISANAKKRLIAGMSGLKQRASTLLDLLSTSRFYLSDGRPEVDSEAQQLITPLSKALCLEFMDKLGSLSEWSEAQIESAAKEFLKEKELKMPDLLKPLRAFVTGTMQSPAIYQVIFALGLDECKNRIAE